jgi:hypothetical protein
VTIRSRLGRGLVVRKSMRLEVDKLCRLLVDMSSLPAFDLVFTVFLGLSIVRYQLSKE